MPDADDIAAPTPSIPQSITAPSLPDLHLNHTAAFVNEIENRLHAFGSAIAALKQAKEGAEIEHNTMVAELNGKHLQHIQKLDRKIADMERSQKMAQAAFDSRPADIRPAPAVEPEADREGS